MAGQLDLWSSCFGISLSCSWVIALTTRSCVTWSTHSQRARGEPFKRCYAFADYGGETASSVEAEWEAKGVCAIAYKTSLTHHHLYETLKALADLQEEGLTSKRSLALRYADSPPVDARDPIGRRVTWALSDPSGKVAEAFASAEPAPPLGWLGHIEEAGLLGLTKQRSGTEGERNLLAARAAGTAAARLSEVTFHLARWLARHLNNPELARKAIWDSIATSLHVCVS